MKYIPRQKGEIARKKDYSKRVIFKPQDFLETGHQLQEVTIPPQTTQRAHLHRQQTEAYFILSGKAVLTVSDKDYPANPGDAFIIFPNEVHSFANNSNRPFKLVVFKLDYPEKDDTIWYDPEKF